MTTTSGGATAFLLLCLLPLLLLPAAHSQGTGPAYNCSTNTVYPCQSYAFYRAQANQRDLSDVGDLFGISRLLIARASNLTTSAVVSTGEPLLIPLTCGCDTKNNISYFPVAYQIAAGNTYYLVSTTFFANLTSYPVVIDVNPTLVPTNLTIGTIVTFPIFCQCPPTSLNSNNKTSLVTYVMQPSDTYASVASAFGTTVQNLTSLNGRENSSATFNTILVPFNIDNPPPVILRRNSTQQSPPPPPPQPAQGGNDRKGTVVGLSIGLGVMGLLWIGQLLVLGLLWRRYNSRRKVDGGESGGQGGRWNEVKGVDQKQMPFAGGGFAASGGFLVDEISEWLDKYKVFQIEELTRATSDFDEGRLIKGSVYKGIIDGEVYAVKKMKWNACGELKILQKVNHTNLVKLEGFCIDQDGTTCYLVYEFVENGSLDAWLSDSDTRNKLDWRARVRIALDLANGLQYVHEHTWPRVVHKDIKSSNVLLDSRLRAKIANFGLAKTGLNAVTTNIVGTQGYIAPEYLSDGLVSTKMDIFAYGVILLELVSGRPAINDNGEALWSEAERVLFTSDRNRASGDKVAVKRVKEWMDDALKHGDLDVAACAESAASVISVARACLHKDPARRPSMVDVAYQLSKADDVLSDFSADGFTVSSSGEVVAR